MGIEAYVQTRFLLLGLAHFLSGLLLARWLMGRWGWAGIVWCAMASVLIVQDATLYWVSLEVIERTTQ